MVNSGKYLLHTVWILYLSLPPSSEDLVNLASSLIKQVFDILTEGNKPKVCVESP